MSNQEALDVHVFQICECDAVAAHTLEEAIEWYKKETGLEDDDLYSAEEIEIVDPDYRIYESEGSDKMISIREVVKEQWNGKPFIACTSEW